MGNYDARKRMLRFCEACYGCSFYFLASLIKILQVKTVFASYNLKHSLPMFLKCFLIVAQFQPPVSYGHMSYKKCVFIIVLILLLEVPIKIVPVTRGQKFLSVPSNINMYTISC